MTQLIDPKQLLDWLDLQIEELRNYPQAGALTKSMVDSMIVRYDSIKLKVNSMVSEQKAKEAEERNKRQSV